MRNTLRLPTRSLCCASCVTHTGLLLGACIDFGRDSGGGNGMPLHGATQFPMDRLAIITELCAGGT